MGSVVPMTNVLLTNDDGVGSPAVLPFARSLRDLGEVTVCVPDRARSWIGKAITRSEEVRLGQVELEGETVHTCSGYPADTAQLGIHVVSPRPPDLVVSGINLGFNHGAAFLMSSGTVGAALEAWISGLPAIAFSTGGTTRDHVDYAGWRSFAESPDAADDWIRLADLCVELTREILEAGLHDHADIVSVNLPYEADGDTPRHITTIARVGYDRLFRSTDAGGYRHDFGGILEFGDMAGTDVAAARQGAVSITPVRVPHAADVPDGVRAALERG